jgi:ATP-dependent DNA helicase RecG
MLKPETPVNALAKIGPKYKALLEKLEIRTIEDLLYHFPFRYDDFSNKCLIKDLKVGEQVTVEATLGSIDNIFTRFGKKLTKAKILDETGSINVLWFNQQYLASVLKPGKVYSFTGRVGDSGGKVTLISPNFEEKTDNSLNTGRLVSVYPETAGISSKWLRSRINDVLSAEIALEEFLPDELLIKQKISDIQKAIRQIHFPKSQEEADSSRKRFELEELFLELLKVEKRRNEWSVKLEANTLQPYKTQIQELIASLPFKLTDSQIKAVDEISADMQQPHPMNRLLEGDVGTGKTIVAVIAAYLAFLNGLKVLYMAPTEILAKQHYETIKQFLPELKVDLRTGSTGAPSEGWDILIGTHALLYTNDSYKNVGLVIIDEQHRFGVEQRGKIIELGKGDKVPHLLAMTATPIPRTLALTLYGDLAISVLKTHPHTERKITTKVISMNAREKAYDWIKEKNEPTFIVCPFIEISDNAELENVKAAQAEFQNLSEGVFSGVSVGLLHGRMKPAEKQAIIEKFRSGEIKVLVSTPVIEVGIDIPDATVMVIESAERYGLASLHQLRGRVGRGNKEGFCFAIMSNNARQSYARLKNLEAVDNGLELAEIDLKMRGQGDVFGTMQHGDKKLHIARLDNLELLEQAKGYAQEYYPKLEEFPKLKKKLAERHGDFVKAN